MDLTLVGHDTLNVNESAESQADYERKDLK